MAFESEATNLDPYFADTNGGVDIIHRSLDRGSINNLTVHSPGNRTSPSLAENEQITLSTTASIDPFMETNGVADIYEADADPDGGIGCCALLSYDFTDDHQLDAPSTSPAVSADGVFAAFETAADFDSKGDTNGLVDIHSHQ